MLDIKEDHDKVIDVAHNYARMENHFGENVMVHRKGATSAKEGEIGIIPGSQGSMSYIVKGKGNADSFDSCSHGAGRKMGRKEAQRKLNLEDEIANLDDKGVIHSVRNVGDLDEATGAYKDIEEVMDNQTDLVSPMIQLRPLAVLKA
jgi:tRNA-splicing ligase RtcB